jgi:phenylacetate-CoA ligase
LEILEYAVNHTKFYAQFKLKVGISGFPLVNKNGIRAKLDDFLSDAIPESDRIPVITSGSTGTPFKSYQDKSKKQRNSADTIYFASLAGFSIGEKLYYLKIWSDYNKKSRKLQWVQNIVPIDVLNLKQNSKDVIEQLNRNKGSFCMLGYSSAYETLVAAIREMPNLRRKWKIKSILTMSESLPDGIKEEGEALFGCPVLSRYSNIENGIIAQQTLNEQRFFIINEASFYVEIFDSQEERLLPYGNLGRIVVTDFYNKAMPLIRYDTGDLGIMDVKVINGVKQQVLTKIEGRKLDQIYNTKGELISSYIVYKNMWNYTEIQQYQIVQKDKNKYVFKISINGEFERESQLKDEFLKYLGYDADFTIEYVKEIPLLASGKRRKVVNEWKKY